METIKDLVSVIIPTYNRAGLIARSAKSVLNQTYKNLELIIVDDGSTDDTEDIVQTLNDERVIYIKQTNQGACAARNNGIDHAKGEFIAFQDSDDVWHVDKLEKQIKCLKETGADLVVCGCRVWRGNSFDKSFLKYSGKFLENDKWPFAIGTQTFCGASHVFKEVKFNNEIKRWQDFEILIRIQKKFKIYCQKEILFDYYDSPISISKSYINLLGTLQKIFISNKYEINLKRKFNDDLAINIILNVLPCKDKVLKMKIINFAFNISNNKFYVKLRYWLYEFKIHYAISKIYKFFKN